MVRHVMILGWKGGNQIKVDLWEGREENGWFFLLFKLWKKNGSFVFVSGAGTIFFFGY